MTFCCFLKASDHVLSYFHIRLRDVTLRDVTLVVFAPMLRVRGAGQKHGRLHVICRAAVTLAASHSRYSSSYLPTVTTLITRLRSSF